MGITVCGTVRLFLPAIVCLLSSAAFAETKQLSLAQALEISSQNNGELKSLREERGIHDAGRLRAGLLPNPSLELEGSTGALTGSSAENSVSVGVSQEILLAGKRDKRINAAERQLEAYGWQLADRERVLREEVKGAFYDAILAEQRLKLADRLIELNGQLLEVSRERLAAGDIPELELNLVRLELTRSEGARIELERGLLQNRARLLSLMGVPPGSLAVPSGDLAMHAVPTGALADLKRLALGQRPDLKALAAEKGRGDADVVLAQADAVPNLTAGVSLSRETTAMEVGGIEGKDTAYTVGVKLSLPIAVFDRNQAVVQEARARRSSAETRQAAAAAVAEREVETAWASLQNAEQVLSLYRSNIMPQLEENLTLTQEAYRLGEVGIQAVIREQKNFFEVGDGFLVALHARQTALLRLESAVATDFNGGAQ